MWKQDLYLKAWNFACRAHNGQTLPGSDIPYINHIGTVAMEILAAISLHTTTEDADLTIQCALLHDVIEDTAVTYSQLQMEFGQEVADGVLALTKDHTIPAKKERMRDSLARIRKQPHGVWMVKMADRITNLQPPPQHWPPEKISNYRDEAREILTALRSADEQLAQRLGEKIESYQETKCSD